MIKALGLVASGDGETYEVYAFLDSDMDPIDTNADGIDDVAYVIIMLDDEYVAVSTGPVEHMAVH